ncbi:MAG: transglycosylase domain-containing protein [Syntrophobacteraceae bacterium]|nr:transglycosylase domain-containing protein [Syntrophobacteraceae bacterium]
MELFIKKRKWLRFFLGGLSLFLFLSVISAAGFSYYLYSKIEERFASRRWSVPTIVFSSTVPIYRGQPLSLDRLRRMLEERRYTEAPTAPVLAGQFMTSGSVLTVNLRVFPFPGMDMPSRLVQFNFTGNRISDIVSSNQELPLLELEPVELARLYGPKRESRILVDIRQVPENLIDAVLAIEDRRFYEHGAVDPRGILRAMFADLRAGRIVQGGSTITQQLVKNCFLKPERTFHRKLVEFSMSLILNGLYTKEDILEMYLNEIFMGRNGSVAIHGIGEAALYYFGRNVEDLTLTQSALLAGMIRAPNFYSPLINRAASLARRNEVLERMLALGMISPSEYNSALVEVLRLVPAQDSAQLAPYFVDYVRMQAQVLYDPRRLSSAGLNIYTTLQPEMAAAARKAIREGLADTENEAAEGDGSSASAPEHLQAALIALRPATGELYALVGGKDYGRGGFDRVLDGHYQAGSAILPFIYLSALDRSKLSDWLMDLPTPYQIGGISWTPTNTDGVYRGRVSFRQALEQSLNAATVNLAAQTGANAIIATLERAGMEPPPESLPALALGAFDVTPMQLARAYASLAGGGKIPFLHSLKEVVAEDGKIIDRRHIGFSSVTSAAKAFLITNILEGSVDRGSADGVKQRGIDFECAGQTGTTIGSGGAWFIGYTPDLLTVVWVGREDNKPGVAIGRKGAEKVWARFMGLVRPWIQPGRFDAPPDVVKEMICPQTGLEASPSCPDPSPEYFLSTNKPAGDGKS